MSDKEVGELWAWYEHGKIPDVKGFSLTMDWTKLLIRKLVEERVKLRRGEPTERTHLAMALADFGIPESEWSSS